ncbi:binding-protein-dependent transport systems inner membrane component [Thermovirga lienii DSM 17291]|uniref:Binding-protein-dependent transport systems inner membrane component n=1 Tax=Thermovirga lienii (strain ATCC BAA-1197 / DSM 17291 / Cas60314) TaxID=580340 RepID=G7V8Y3_THELD|nr:iron ABC transporter permease [Thermovirga lienii]AER67517.1 binding-protein-dependent transport systems inner membrane component [Thermovirga lienii DSM 17291]
MYSRKIRHVTKSNVLAAAVSLLVIILAGLPIFYLAIRGLISGKELRELIFSQRTVQLFANTILLSSTVLCVCFALSLPLAWLTTQTNVLGRRLLVILSTAPLVVPSYIGAYAVITAFGPGGMLVEAAPQVYGFWGAVMTLSLYTYPYLFINLQTAFLSSDESLKEASYSLGYGPLITFFRIVLPTLVPGLLSGAILVLLYTISDFGAVALLRYDTFVRAIYIQYEASFNKEYAAALGLIVMSLSASFILIKTHIHQRFLFRGSGKNHRPSKIVDLGMWRWPVSVIAYTIPILALGLPIVVTGYWLIQGLASEENLKLPISAVTGSFSAAAVGAIVTGVVGLAVAYISLRHHKNPLVRAMEAVIHIQYGLPSIAVALAFVFFVIRFAYPLYQTFFLLILAYSIRFLPHTVGASKTALAHIHPQVYDGAKSLGASKSRIFRTITWPLARTGIIGGMTMTFLNIVKELPLTLVLSPLGFETLATNMWGSMEEAFYARAAVPALIIILLSSLSIAWVLPKTARDGNWERSESGIG